MLTRSSIILALLLPGCSLSVSPILTDIATHTAAPVDTATATLAPTWTPTPTATSTPTVTHTPTRDWSATPTQMTSGDSIIEVTPLGDDGPVTGTYINNSNQRVRNCPNTECDIVRTVSAGQTWRFYDWRSWLPVEAWVCINVACNEWMASTWESKEMGVVTFDN